MSEPTYGEYVVRPDEGGLGVIYTSPSLIGFRVLLVPLERLESPWAMEARGES